MNLYVGVMLAVMGAGHVLAVTAELVRLDEAERVLPGPRVDDSPLHVLLLPHGR